MLCHKGKICASSSSSPRLPVYLFVAGPGPLHEIAVPALSRCPLGRVNSFSLLALVSTSRISLSAIPLPPLLTLAFPFFLSFSFAYDCTPPKILVSSHFLPYFLVYAIPPSSSSAFFANFSRTALSAMAGDLFFWRAPSLIFCCFTLLTLRLIAIGYVPSCPLNTVLLVVLEHPTVVIFLAAVTLFPAVLRTSRSLPVPFSCLFQLGYDHIGRKTYFHPININVVSTCESVRIASALPTGALSLPITCAMCAFQEQSFETSTSSYVHGSTIGNSSSPRFPLNVTAFSLCSLHIAPAHSFNVRSHSPFSSIF